MRQCLFYAFKFMYSMISTEKNVSDAFAAKLFIAPLDVISVMKYVMSQIQRMILLKKSTMQYKKGDNEHPAYMLEHELSYILNNRTTLLCCQYLYDDNTETIYV